MSIFHISSSKRSLGNAGGVEKFGWYLQQAIGCTLLTPDEIPRTLFKKDDIIIGDGYHVESFNTNHFKVISVIHGTWKEYWLRNDKPPFAVGEIERQHKVWTNPNILKVAVSESAAYYTYVHHGVSVNKIILNSVYTDLFKPVKLKCNFCNIPENSHVLVDCTSNECREKPVIVYPCQLGDYNKANKGLLGEIIKRLEDEFHFVYLDAAIGEEHIKFHRGDMFLAPSRYEGNSYFALEGMSCGLIPVVSRVGLFEITNFGIKVAEILDYRSTVDAWVDSIRYAWLHRQEYKPREWIVENASFDIFKKQWTDLIKSL